MISSESLPEEMTTIALPNGPQRLAHFNNQPVFVKHLKKPTINLTKTLVAEINQVLSFVARLVYRIKHKLLERVNINRCASKDESDALISFYIVCAVAKRVSCQHT